MTKTHLMLRLRYQTASNFNPADDNMEFVSLDHASRPQAVLEVITQP